MSQFSYQATDPSGQMITGVMEAGDKGEVIERLQKENFFPISVQPGKKAKTFSSNIIPSSSTISQKELLNFTRQTATLLRSGMELDRCLTILYQLSEKEKTKTLVKKIQEDVHSGETLSGAMEKRKGAFSPLYLNMVRAGETGGFLEKVFDRLAWYLESRMKMAESIRSALVYPAVILVTGIAALFILTTHVIPRFGSIFEQMGGELPATTQFLVSISSLVIAYWPMMIIGLIAAFAIFKIYLSSNAGKRTVDSMVINLPVVGDLVRKTATAQFTRTLGTLLQSGVPIINALEIVKETISNSLIADTVSEAAAAIKEGKRMSKILDQSGIFPPLAVQMIMVGEESGQMDDMMIRTAHIFDDEVETALKRMLTLFEPAMILAMGLVVAFVVVSMLSAIVSINDLPF